VIEIVAVIDQWDQADSVEHTGTETGTEIDVIEMIGTEMTIDDAKAALGLLPHHQLGALKRRRRKKWMPSPF